MKKIKSLITVFAIIIMATVISGCSDGTNSKNDPLVGTWLHQVQAPVSAKRIDELVITKEDGKYQIEENEELVNAIYGNALKYFEEMERE